MDKIQTAKFTSVLSVIHHVTATVQPIVELLKTTLFGKDIFEDDKYDVFIGAPIDDTTVLDDTKLQKEKSAPPGSPNPSELPSNFGLLSGISEAGMTLLHSLVLLYLFKNRIKKQTLGLDDINSLANELYSMLLNEYPRDTEAHPKHENDHKTGKLEQKLPHNYPYFHQPRSIPEHDLQNDAVELEKENIFLRKELDLLKSEYYETLADFGQVSVARFAEENEEKNLEIFQRIYSNSKAGKSVTMEDPTVKGLSYTNEMPNTKSELNPSKKSITNGDDSSLPIDETVALGAEAVMGKREQILAKGKQITMKNGKSFLMNKNTKQGSSNVQFLNGEETEKRGGVNQVEKEQVALLPDMATSSKNKSKDETSKQAGSSKTTSTRSQQKRKSHPERLHKVNETEIHGIHNVETTSEKEDQVQKTSIQQDESYGGEYISLGSVPPTSVAATLYNNYKLLLINIAERLLSSEAVQLKMWAIQQFQVDDVESAFKVLVQLDKKGIINASNLVKLKIFLESITRFDLSYIIDAFLLGDYRLLRYSPPARKYAAAINRAVHLRQGATSEYQSLPTNTGSHSSPNTLITPQQLVNQATSISPTYTSLTTQTKPNDNGSGNVVHQPGSVRNAAGSTFKSLPEAKNSEPGFAEITAKQKIIVDVADGPATCEIPGRESNSLRSSNGATKIAQPVNTDDTDPHFVRKEDDTIDWLCSHYKRRCYVKFECCDKFWPCHRCHNNQSNCSKKKLKSRDTKMVKCAQCNEEQDFAEFCRKCHTKFANYYCGVCKHLTGTDDHPYHCPKCTICRIHGDRSFHCDTCGVCLDVQLRGNHKCREGSAHDECCICLEDAFTGCQILPCSHKVHKECANQMIRSGITRCPICRESFAHKLERRPFNSRKYSRK